MAGDRKGKGKKVVQQRKKRTREDREQESVEAVADAADRQGSLRIRDPQAQGEPQQQLRRPGRTRQPETAQTTPESRSRPRTRGGGTHRAAGHDSEREAAGQDSDAESEPPQVELLDLRGIPGPRVKRLRYVTPETWFFEQRDIGVDRCFHTLLQESFYNAYCQMDIKISVTPVFSN